MHHAFLVAGQPDEALLYVDVSLREPGLDVLHFLGSRMGIDEVRQIISEANILPISHQYRSFVIGYNDITIEAQNALLKILEEPPRTTRFYIVSNAEERLIPTLRSRLMSLSPEESVVISKRDFSKFFSGTPSEKIKIIESLVKKEDVSGMRALIEAIELWAREKRDTATLSEIVSLLPVFNSPGASKKMILEHLALSLSENV